MSDDSSPKLELPPLSDEARARFLEYQAKQEREYNDAMAWLEGASIEPEQHAAYETTLPEMLALPLGELAWPYDDPRYRLHHAIEYGDKLTARRADVETRFAGRLPPSSVYDIRRYALAALHAFKELRSNPEPEGSSVKS